MKLLILLIASTVTLVACGSEDSEPIKSVDVDKVAVDVSTSTVAKTSDKRWYITSQKTYGKQVFKENCASCHGDKGQGLVKDWKKSDVNGKFPAPPLNGTAHAWHHSKELLLRTVNKGGIPLGGTMPAFKDKLNDKQKEAVLAYVMSLWPDKTYTMWAQRNLK